MHVQFIGNLVRLEVHMLMSNDRIFVDEVTGFTLTWVYGNNLYCVKGQFRGNKFVGVPTWIKSFNV